MPARCSEQFDTMVFPWDDDIDVVMPREDYERLCSIGPSEFSRPYFFQNEDTDRFFARNYSKLRNSETTAILDHERGYRYPFNQGIFIDIFPIDHVPADPEIRDRYYKELLDLDSHSWQWRIMIHFYQPKTGNGLVKQVNYYLKHIYYKYLFKGGYRYYMDKHHNLVTKFDGEDTGWVGESIIEPLGRQLWRSEWVRDTVIMPFEMIQVPVPSCYEDCLSASFGIDWNTPKRAPSLHGGVFFDTDRSYTHYLKQ